MIKKNILIPFKNPTSTEHIFHIINLISYPNTFPSTELKFIHFISPIWNSKFAMVVLRKTTATILICLCDSTLYTRKLVISSSGSVMMENNVTNMKLNQ